MGERVCKYFGVFFVRTSKIKYKLLESTIVIVYTIYKNVSFNCKPKLPVRELI